MKTTTLWRTGMAASAAAVMMAAVASARADESTPAANPERRFTGVISSVDPAEHVVTVKEFLQTRRFNLGNTCTYTFPDKNTGTAVDLRPGQKVTVRYQADSGVLVANQITEEPRRFVGTVASIDPATHRLTMRRSLSDKTFQLASDCAVVLRNEKTGALTDVQPGQRVTVTYETPYGTATARRIAQTSETFTGTLTALDMTERTIKAKTLLGTKKFNLADGCSIVVNGKLNGRMSDLKPGETLTINYDDLNGVSVANRLAAPSSAPAVSTAQAQR